MLTVYRAKDFADAKRIGAEVLEHVGKGHSIGIHTNTMDHARELAEDLEVVRVLVNQAHTFGNGGGFDSGLAVHAFHGLRYVAGELDIGKSQLQELSQHHPSGHHDP